MSEQPAPASFLDVSPDIDSFLAAVIDGLSSPRKTAPCKFLYDQRGAELFERICTLPEYYPTQTEITLMLEHSSEIAALLGPEAQIIELGSGAAEKTRILLDACEKPASYVAVDISRKSLEAAAATLAQDYPDLEVHAICADFTEDITINGDIPGRRRTCFFPGSTIGNFEPEETVALLAKTATLAGTSGGFLVGVDLKKDPAILHAAYDDAEGVTAAFNLNLLVRINRELGGNFDTKKFRHRAPYNEAEGRIEMHIESLCEQEVTVAGQRFAFAKGESIHTENSYKYDISQFQDVARKAGFRPDQVWTDPEALFSIHYLAVPEGGSDQG